MHRFASIVLLVLAGCGKPEPPPPPAAAVSDWILVPAGEFTMGDAAGRPDETPHRVSVSAFHIERVPVTQELFQKVMGLNPSKRKEPKNPVERVQWTTAARFCNKASERDGLSPCYNLETWECDFEADGYRLPTEAEWEYACRAGSTGKYSFGDDASQISRHAWCKPHSGGSPHAVGQKAPNGWGLQDMHGNVWQWCNDWYGEGYYKASPAKDPRGPAEGTHRVLRGGAADAPAERCTASYRLKETPAFGEACFGADYYGFRRARSASGKRKEKIATQVPVERANLPPPPPPTPAPAVQSAKIDPSRLKGTIVFVSNRSGSLDLWRMHASGKDARALTKDSHPDADPRFSPDGKKVLYTTVRGGFPELWTMNRDGSDSKKLAAGSQGTWSPDGKTILFIRDNQAFVLELASGTEHRVTPDAWERCGVPAWHPDGKSFAVASRHEESIGIYILSLDGKENRRFKTSEPCCTPHFSKDGKKLLFQTTRGRIHQIGTDGKNEEPVTFGADIQHDGRLSPDGTLLVFSRAPAAEGPWQICVADLQSDDLDFIPLTRDASNSLPDWDSRED